MLIFTFCIAFGDLRQDPLRDIRSFDQKRWDRVKGGIEQSHKFNGLDQAWTLALLGGSPYSWIKGYLLLRDAEEHRLYSKARLLENIEQHAVESVPSGVDLSASCYAHVVGLSDTSDLVQEKVRRFRDTKRPNVIDGEERSYVRAVLGSSNDASKLIVLDVLADKSGLKGESLSWALSQISHTLAKSHGTQRQYIEFVHRVIKKRNMNH